MAIADLKRRMRDDPVVGAGQPRPADLAEARAKMDAEREAKLAEQRAATMARFGDDPTVAMMLEAFPGAEILAVRSFSQTPEEAAADAERARVDALHPPPPPTRWPFSNEVWLEACGASARHAEWVRRWLATGIHRKTDLGPWLWEPALNRHTWPWFPQKQVSGRRIPVGTNERVDGPDPANPDKVIDKKKGISPRWLAEQAATPDRTGDWIELLRKRGTTNVQVAVPIGGAASMYMSGVDSDLDHGPYAARLRRVVEEHLPPTPYVRGRFGSQRKLFLYRQDPADRWQGLPKLALKAPEGGDPDAKKQEVEFLASAGKSVTILGRHYHGGEVLEWESLTPGLDEGATPFRAPVVSSAQFAAFHAALLQEFAADLAPVDPRGPRGSGVVREYDGNDTDLAGLRLPAEPRYHGEFTYDEDGRVILGREAWTFAHCGYVACLATNLNATAEALATLVADDLPNHVRVAGWSDVDGGVHPYILDKMRRAVAYRDGRVRDHAFTGYRVARVGNVEVAASENDYEAPEYADPDIRALVPRQSSISSRRHRTPRNPKLAADRALLDDRSALTDGVATTIKATVRRHLDNVAGVQGLLDDQAPQQNRLQARRDAAAAHDAEADRLRGERSALIDAGTPADDAAVVDLDARIRAEGWAARTAAAAVTGKGTDWKVLARTVLVLKGPTGSGKTTTALYEVLAIKARLAAMGKRLGTQLFFAPSHALLGEVARTASALTTDAIVVSEEEAQALIDAAKEAAKIGLRVRIYRGRGEVCTHPAWPTLREAGISGQKLCKSTRRVLVDGEWTDEPVECDAYKDKSCVVWSQRLGLADIDILFMPSAYLVLPIPEEVRAVATGVIADESIASQFLAYAMMPIEALKLERTVPRINKREQEKGLTAEVLIHDRYEIRDVVRPVVERNADPAAALMAHDWEQGSYAANLVHLNRLLDSAVNINGRAMDTHEDVAADMTARDADLLAEVRALSRFVGEEKRFWATVRERVRQLITDRGLAGMAASVRAAAESPEDTPAREVARQALPRIEATAAALRTAKGDRDYRIQALRHEGDVPTVRVSFRRKNSFADLPTLLMDASADEGMIRKIYKGRPVETITAECPPHLQVLMVPDRSMSDTSLLPYKDRSPFAAAQTLVDIRTVIDGLAALFGYSQLGVASTLAVELAANTAWRAPANTIWLHYNNVVGFNYLRYHPAMLVVGRQELPIPVIDALVGGLTYDDDVPELPIDRLGTGLDAKGNRVRAMVTQRQQPMRDGSDITVDDWTYAGAWARAVQAQAREEQVRQAIGRLRPVYREGKAPLLMYVGRALPSDLVVDAVASLDDVVQSDACRLGRDLRHGGIVRYRHDLGGPAASSASSIPKADEGAHVVAMREGRHHAQRGLAKIGFVLSDGREFDGLVPMADLSHEELRRRVDRYLGLCVPALFRAPGSEITVVHVPERDEKAIVRGDDKKMVARLGDRAARQVAEDMAEDLADRVLRAARAIREEAKAKAARDRAPEPEQGPEVLATAQAMAAVLTVRKRAAGENAADLATLVNPILPEVLGPAMARAMAETPDATAVAREAARAAWATEDAMARNGDVDESEPEPAVEQDNVAAMLLAALDGDPDWEAAA